jgi:hypothetical protein
MTEPTQRGRIARQMFAKADSHPATQQLADHALENTHLRRQAVRHATAPQPKPSQGRPTPGR